MSQKGTIHSLPFQCVLALDEEGVVRGKTWRQMPGRGCRDGRNVNRTLQALNWWLWKRGLLNLREAKAEARAAGDAIRDMKSEEARS